jgi:hypothetical protein
MTLRHLNAFITESQLRTSAIRQLRSDEIQMGLARLMSFVGNHLPNAGHRVSASGGLASNAGFHQFAFCGKHIATRNARYDRGNR